MLEQHHLWQLEEEVPEVQCSLQSLFGDLRGAILTSCPVRQFIGNSVVGRMNVPQAAVLGAGRHLQAWVSHL